MLRSVREGDWQTNEPLACRHSCNIESLFAIRRDCAARLSRPKAAQPDRPEGGARERHEEYSGGTQHYDQVSCVCVAQKSQ